MCDLRQIFKIQLKDGKIVETSHYYDDTIFEFSDSGNKSWETYLGLRPPQSKKPGFYFSVPFGVSGYCGDIYFDGNQYLKENVDYDVYEWKDNCCGGNNSGKIYTKEDIRE